MTLSKYGFWFLCIYEGCPCLLTSPNKTKHFGSETKERLYTSLNRANERTKWLLKHLTEPKISFVFSINCNSELIILKIWNEPLLINQDFNQLQFLQSQGKLDVDSGMQCILSGNNDGKTDHPNVHSHSQAGVSTLTPALAPAWPGTEYCITHQLDLARFSCHMNTSTVTIW